MIYTIPSGYIGCFGAESTSHRALIAQKVPCGGAI